MYVILINDDNTLSAPKKQRIIQRSKLVDTMWFLTKPMYNGYDMTNSTVLLEYLKPTSKEYKTETLVLSDDMYEDHLKYVLPVDTEFTKEAGSLELQLSFIYVDIDADGKPIQRVRKIAPPLKVEITPISAWSDIVPDDALNAIDKKIIEVDAKIKALDDIGSIFNSAKADNIMYKDNTLQLTANGDPIGNAVHINSYDDSDIEDGVPAIDFNDVTNDTPPDDSNSTINNANNVVEF